MQCCQGFLQKVLLNYLHLSFAARSVHRKDVEWLWSQSDYPHNAVRGFCRKCCLMALILISITPRSQRYALEIPQKRSVWVKFNLKKCSDFIGLYTWKWNVCEEMVLILILTISTIREVCVEKVSKETTLWWKCERGMCLIVSGAYYCLTSPKMRKTKVL